VGHGMKFMPVKSFWSLLLQWKSVNHMNIEGALQVYTEGLNNSDGS
jgi:hypothetical protein